MRVVLFDLDGTLQDSESLATEGHRHGFRATLGREPTDQELRGLTGAPVRKVLAEWFPGEWSRIYAAGVAHYELHASRIRCYDGIADLIATLDALGHSMGIVSSKQRRYILKELEMHGFSDQMRTVVGQEDTAQHKPLPEPLLLATRLIGAPPSDCIYIGDQPTDMLAARAAGMIGIRALWGEAPGTVPQGLMADDVIAHTPGEVLAFLQTC